METRSKKNRIGPLPEGNRRGAPGADAGCHSIRPIGGGGLNRRVLPDKNTTAEPTDRLDNSEDSRAVTSAVDVSQAASATQPATTKAGKPRVRMKWTKDMNIFIMRTYFHITKLEEDRTMYCTQLFEKFKLQYPELNVTEQRIADQRRVIIRNKLLSDDTLNRIRFEISEQLKKETEENTNFRQQTNISQINQSPIIHNTSLNLGTSSDTECFVTDLTVPTQHTNESIVYDSTFIQTQSNIDFDPSLVDTLSNELESNMIKYNGMDPACRPLLPKIRPSRKLSDIISIFNQKIIPSKLSSLENLSDTHSLIYSIAISVVTHFKLKINIDRTSTNNRVENNPPWKKRLESDIEQLRKDINRLTQYKNGNSSSKLEKKVKQIINNTKQHSVHENFNKRIEDHLDTLKQKLLVKSHRLARYKKAKVRKDNNRLFKTNEKQFYRKLKGNDQKILNPPSQEALKEFWQGIWSDSTEHNKNASWIQEEIGRAETIEEMPFEDIDVVEINTIINKTHNWKAAGIDGVHNFWIKRLNSLHSTLAEQISEILKGNQNIPEFLTKGITYMLPKSSRTQDPSQYRPITCLPTLYKIITSCITNKIIKHTEKYNILTEEQKGCRRGHMGCKEQLIIDSTILKYCQRFRKNLYVAYIDYKKAFDSVPHSWLIEILNIYKINPLLIQFLKSTMETWRTTLKLQSETTNISVDELAIKKGIFQGDSLSPLWFCLALNPLSRTLNDSKFGFDIKNGRSVLHQITHLLYMDDLKIFANKNSDLHDLLNITTTFSKDIRMDFGLDKCRKLNIEKGKIVGGNYLTDTDDIIEAIKDEEVYKYLGYNQARLLEHRTIKDKLKKEYNSRIHSLCKMHLSSKHLFKSINTYAVPVLTYSFGVIKWSNTDLHGLEVKTRTILTQHRYHHPKSAIERVIMSRKVGGRGLIEISHLHKKQVINLKQFFRRKKITSRLHKAIIEIDKQYTPLNLSDDSNIETIDKTGHLEEINRKWRQKELHGRHPNDLNQTYIDTEASNKWLELSGLFPETEGFMLAIQDQVINTKNYRKYIIKDSTVRSDLCRKCHSKPETIQHITGACMSLTQNDYTHRHNQLVNIIHQKLAINFKLTQDPYTPYYKYTPRAVLENQLYKIYYDRTIITDHTIYNNRPDITLVDKENKHTYIIDIAVPNTNNIQKTITEKIRKYTELQEEITRVWKMNRVTIVPIVISTTGVIPKQIFNSFNVLNLSKYTYLTLQKAAILNTCRIVRKFLQLDLDNNTTAVQNPVPS